MTKDNGRVEILVCFKLRVVCGGLFENQSENSRLKLKRCFRLLNNQPGVTDHGSNCEHVKTACMFMRLQWSKGEKIM